MPAASPKKVALPPPTPHPGPTLEWVHAANSKPQWQTALDILRRQNAVIAAAPPTMSRAPALGLEIDLRMDGAGRVVLRHDPFESGAPVAASSGAPKISSSGVASNPPPTLAELAQFLEDVLLPEVLAGHMALRRASGASLTRQRALLGRRMVLKLDVKDDGAQRAICSAVHPDSAALRRALDAAVALELQLLDSPPLAPPLLSSPLLNALAIAAMSTPDRQKQQAYAATSSTLTPERSSGTYKSYNRAAVSPLVYDKRAHAAVSATSTSAAAIVVRGTVTAATGGSMGSVEVGASPPPPVPVSAGSLPLVDVWFNADYCRRDGPVAMVPYLGASAAAATGGSAVNVNAPASFHGVSPNGSTDPLLAPIGGGSGGTGVPQPPSLRGGAAAVPAGGPLDQRRYSVPPVNTTNITGNASGVQSPSELNTARSVLMESVDDFDATGASPSVRLPAQPQPGVAAASALLPGSATFESDLGGSTRIDYSAMGIKYGGGGAAGGSSPAPVVAHRGSVAIVGSSGGGSTMRGPSDPSHRSPSIAMVSGHRSGSPVPAAGKGGASVAGYASSPGIIYPPYQSRMEAAAAAAAVFPALSIGWVGAGDAAAPEYGSRDVDEMLEFIRCIVRARRPLRLPVRSGAPDDSRPPTDEPAVRLVTFACRASLAVRRPRAVLALQRLLKETQLILGPCAVVGLTFWRCRNETITQEDAAYLSARFATVCVDFD